MERLTFSESNPYNGLEAAIHLARYSIVHQICQDKRVLDVACGEGYGCHFMSTWGARHVDGVDISAEAVDAARRLFGSETVLFANEKAELVDEVFSNRSFDLIVSLETIEHVEDPIRFLTALKRLASRTGIIVVSCPNDWWYYPAASQTNPYHRRKYRFDEFQELTQQILGPADSWYLGGPISGFANVPLATQDSAEASSSQKIMLQQRTMATSLLLPAEYKMGPTTETCSYFVGIWGLKSQNASAAILPLGMNSFREDAAFSAWGPGRVNQLQSENSRLSAALSENQSVSAQQKADLTRLERKAENAALEAERLSLTLQAEECDRQRFLVQLKRAQLHADSHNGSSPASLPPIETSGIYQPILEIVADFQRRSTDAAKLRSAVAQEGDDVQRERQKLSMQAHALNEERTVMRGEVRRLQTELSVQAQSSGEERESLRAKISRLQTELEQSSAVQNQLRTQFEAQVKDLRDRLWLLEVQTAVYRKFRSRLPSWIAPALRRWARLVTR